VQDVLVGEVWLASGQSNMEWPVANSADAEREIAAARFPLIREFDVTNTVADQPADTVAGEWRLCSPETAGRFSAIGYYFARSLHRRLGVPIGILNSTWGGTAIEAWTDLVTLQSTSAWPAIDTRWQQAMAEHPERVANHPAERAAWQQADAQARATKTLNPLPWPRPPAGPGTPYALSGLFNGMIAPLQPYALRGVLWYQGESNWRRPAEYAGLFPALIQAWRAQWGREELPFYFVQLANFTVGDDPTDRGWAWLREAQTRALALPNTGMVVTLDIGDPKDIHPRNKQEVGRRLALLARAQVYDLPVDWSGPQFASAQREGAALRVRFTHVADGLTTEQKPPQAFEVAGADRKFFPATARLDRDTVIVSAPEVPEPVAVRYAWSNNPGANLFNGTGLPAAPFRSDDW
jgi:sialate O-acetylesterase